MMKMTATALLAGVMLSVGGMSAPALAANNGSGSQQSQSLSMSQDQSRMSHGEFSGMILDVRTAEFDNGQKYKLVKIRSEKGDVAVLNLGPVKNLQDQNANVKEGQHIAASGRSGRINGKPVLVVYSFSTSSGQASGNQSGSNNT